MAAGLTRVEVRNRHGKVLAVIGDRGYGKTTALQHRISEQVFTSGPRAGQKVYTPLSGFSFMLFVLLYLPCAAVIATVGRESGSWKWAGFVLLYTTIIAWTASFAFLQLGNIIHTG